MTRNRTRMLRAGVNYNDADRWNGINTFDMTVTRGFSIWGKGPTNADASRAGAKPDFTRDVITASPPPAAGVAHGQPACFRHHTTSDGSIVFI